MDLDLPQPLEAYPFKLSEGIPSKAKLLSRATLAAFMLMGSLGLAIPTVHAGIDTHPSVAGIQLRKNAVLTNVLDANAQVFIVGSNHTSSEQQLDLLRGLDTFKKLGITDMAVEVPMNEQAVLDEFVKENKSLDWLSSKLAGVDRFDDLDSGHQILVRQYAWARENSVRLYAIDISSTDVLYNELGTLYREHHVDIRAPEDGDAQRSVSLLGNNADMMKIEGKDAAATYYKLWVSDRTEKMGANVNKLANEITKDPKRKLVVLVGSAHASPKNESGLLRGMGADMRLVDMRGLKDYLDVKAQTQSIMYGGGAIIQGSAVDPQTLDLIERTIIRTGKGSEVVVIKKIEGISGVDSIVYLPFVRG